MKFASLGSGSEGNALLISTESGSTVTTVMLDCGFGLREIERRLARVGVGPKDLAGIVVTHEHQDHVGGVFKLARRYRIPVWLSFGTYQAVRKECDDIEWHLCRDGDPIRIGSLELTPYTVPHDAREPLQYVVTDGQAKLGVLTDAGQSTPHLVQALSGCDALVLECNHDTQMLANSTYPPSLRHRIGGAYGHLSNEATAEILAALDKSRLKIIIGAHLSRQNNTPELALEALVGAVDSQQIQITIACQDEGSGWIELAV